MEYLNTQTQHLDWDLVESYEDYDDAHFQAEILSEEQEINTRVVLNGSVIQYFSGGEI